VQARRHRAQGDGRCCPKIEAAVLAMTIPEFSHLPREERAKRYRELAQDARREAARSPGAARNAYVLIAEQWESLAAEAGPEK
jgi:hypothetical protein